MTTATNVPPVAPQLTDHEKAMIARATETNSTILTDGEPTPLATVPAEVVTPVADAERPAWCPEEFWNTETKVVDTEAMAAQYTALKTPEVPKTPEQIAAEAEAAKTATPPDAPFVAAVELANADIAAGGVLTEETYKSFEKIGLGRETLDAYIEGQQAKAELTKMRVYDVAGGEEGFTQMFQWGIANYTEAERTMFDTMMNGGKVEDALSATRALQARYHAAEGKPGVTVVPTSVATSAVGGFTTKDDVISAMKDPKYRTDAKYRGEVQAKIQSALAAGTDLGF